MTSVWTGLVEIPDVKEFHESEPHVGNPFPQLYLSWLLRLAYDDSKQAPLILFNLRAQVLLLQAMFLHNAWARRND